MSPRVVLIGMPGAGKTTTGRKLAKLLKVRFEDADNVVETRLSRSIAQHIADEGEAAFREIEKAVVAELLTSAVGVVAVGGGAIVTESTRGLIGDSGRVVVLLEARIDTLTARVGDARTRPLLAGDPRGRLGQLVEERHALYAQAAEHVVATDGMTAFEVARRIESLLSAQGRT